MKTTCVLVLVFAVLVAAGGCGGGSDIEADRAAVQAILDAYITSIEDEDIDLYASIFVHDPGMVNFGSGAGDRIVGWEALRQVIEAQNAGLAGTTIAQSDVTIDVSSDGLWAWATSLWSFKATIGEAAIELPVRCSWILEKRSAGWLIVHFHKSVGMPG